MIFPDPKVRWRQVGHSAVCNAHRAASSWFSWRGPSWCGYQATEAFWVGKRGLRVAFLEDVLGLPLANLVKRGGHWRQVKSSLPFQASLSYVGSMGGGERGFCCPCLSTSPWLLHRAPKGPSCPLHSARRGPARASRSWMVSSGHIASTVQPRDASGSPAPRMLLLK